MWGRVVNNNYLCLNEMAKIRGMSFIGQIGAKLDAKNRVFFPAGFRRVLQEAKEIRLVVRKDVFENCLVVYPESQWRAEVENVRSRLSRFDADHQKVYRKLISEAQEVTLDSSGRMLLSRNLLDKAGIAQDVLFVGMEQTIEIWAGTAGADDKREPFMSDKEFVDSIKELMTE